MSERSYFSLRYAIPGYTFILLVITLNYVPLLEILKTYGFESAFGAFLAFLSLLSGSAIGFLLTQFYWRWFQFRGAEYSAEPRSIKTLINKYDLARCDEIEDKKEAHACKKKIIVIHDYITHYEREKQKGVFIYIERRWDIYHLLSSTFHTLLIGSVSGLFFRIASHFLLFEFPLSGELFQGFYDFLGTEESWVMLIIIVLVILLLYLLQKGRKWVIYQHDAASSAIISKSEVTRSDLGEVFQPDYFNLGIGKETSGKLDDAGIFSVSTLAKANPKKLAQETQIDNKVVSEYIARAKELIT